MTVVPWASYVNEDQVLYLKIFSVTVLCIYGLTFIFIIDTMRRHEFKLKWQSINLYGFYFLAFLMCLGRYYSYVFLAISLFRDNEWTYQINVNYGYYSATFAIVLIAI